MRALGIVALAALAINGACAGEAPVATTGGNGGGDGLANGGAAGTLRAVDCATSNAAAPCGAWRVPGPFVSRPANVLLVVERSTWMAQIPAGATDTVWAMLSQGLSAALETSADNLSFALLGFPSATSDGCGPTCCTLLSADIAVRGPLARDTIPRIEEVLLTDQPEGETPTAAALATAKQYLTQVDVPATGDSFVVLVSGGGPDCGGAATCGALQCVANLEDRCDGSDNCCSSDPSVCLDDQAVFAQIRALGDAGIMTYVVGLRSSAPIASLFDGFARAGGKPDPASGGAYHPGATMAEIAQTMTSIFKSLATRCQADLPVTPPSPALTRAALACALLPATDVHVDAAAATNHLILEGDVCDELKQAQAPQLDVLYDCPAP